MNKRGQFFLIAALVIVVVIIALFTTYNYLKSKPTDSTSLYLAKEIDFEASQVLSAGVLTQQEREQKIQDLITFYAKTNPDSDIAIFYIDSIGAAKVVLYEQETCEPSLSPPVTSSVVYPITGRAGDSACLDLGGTCRTGSCNTDETLTSDGNCGENSSAVCCIPNPPPSAEPSCADSDKSTTLPLVNQIITFGWTEGIASDGSPYKNEDYCVDSDKVMEHNCVGDAPNQFLSSCSLVLNNRFNDTYVCSDGRCMPQGNAGEPSEETSGSTPETFGNTTAGAQNNAVEISPNICVRADVNRDGQTNLIDMSFVKSLNGCDLNVSSNYENCFKADVNLDNKVNLIDMSLVKSLNGCSQQTNIKTEEDLLGSGSDIKLSPPDVSTDGKIDNSGVDSYIVEKGKAVELRTPSLKEEPGVAVTLKISDIPAEAPAFSPPPGFPLQPEEPPQVKVEISATEENCTIDIPENSMGKVGDCNYWVGVGSSVQDKVEETPKDTSSSTGNEKIPIDIVTNDVFEATQEALFSPEEGVVCFDFTESGYNPELTPDISSIAGRKITEGTLVPIDNMIKLKIGSSLREFEVNDKQDFFVVIKKERLGERVVAAARVIKDLLFS